MTPQITGNERLQQPPKGGVVIRMYNPGFGDIFLLSFKGTDDKPRYMLMDFGVHGSYTAGYADKIRLIAKDILDVTSEHIHLVVLSHQHRDHVSGFYHAKSAFENVDIDELWLAWPEDKYDPIAQELEKEYGKKENALRLAYEKLKASGNLDLRFGFMQILDFAAYSNKDIYDKLLEKVKSVRQPYLRPGEEPLVMDGIEDARFHVLGPPRNISDIIGQEPPEEPSFGTPIINEESSLLLALLAIKGENKLSEEEKEKYWRSLPFERKSGYRIPIKDLGEDSVYPDVKAFFDSHYGLSSYNGSLEYRKIDDDWIAGALKIALECGEHLNNTSLVLAIELTAFDKPKYLLFVGDAQMGNWNSWKETAIKIGENIVFYKVGHHGSHNATLPEVVDKMSSDLVAMIPVDEDWALDQSPPWHHPARIVKDCLRPQTSGRILRTDRIPGSNEELFRLPEATDDDDWEKFKEKVQWDKSSDKLWIQYTISKESNQ